MRTPHDMALLLESSRQVCRGLLNVRSKLSYKYHAGSTSTECPLSTRSVLRSLIIDNRGRGLEKGSRAQ